MNDDSNENIDYILNTLSVNLYPIIASIKGNADFAKTLIENDVFEENRETIIRMIDSIAQAAKELEKIRNEIRTPIKD